jgi:hypothetical protein
VVAVESEVSVRADSFACTSGTQLYDYLKAHKCVGLTAGRALVYSNPRPIRLRLRREGQPFIRFPAYGWMIGQVFVTKVRCHTRHRTNRNDDAAVKRSA